MTDQPIRPSQKKKSVWSFVIVIAFSIIVIFIGLNFTQITPVIYTKYFSLEFTYQDKHHVSLYQEYYMVKQDDDAKQTNFSVAYLGKDDIGKAKVRTDEPAKFAYQYHINPYYKLKVKENKTILTGPTQVILTEPQSKINTLDNGTSTIKLKSGTFSCQVIGNKKVKYIRASIINPR